MNERAKRLVRAVLTEAKIKLVRTRFAKDPWGLSPEQEQKLQKLDKTGAVLGTLYPHLTTGRAGGGYSRSGEEARGKWIAYVEAPAGSYWENLGDKARQHSGVDPVSFHNPIFNGPAVAWSAGPTPSRARKRLQNALRGAKLVTRDEAIAKFQIRRTVRPGD